MLKAGLQRFAERYPGTVMRLCQARRNGRVGHGYLLSGDNARQLEDFVLAWSQVCVCERETADGFACAACTSCSDFAAGKYRELYEVRPKSKSRLIRIEFIRDLERRISLKSTSGRKIGIIYDADRMTEEAQNAFLKTLEEPSPGTVLILVTTRPGTLLPTTKSRCQQITLWDNQFEVSVDGAGELFQTLSTLRRQSGALAASDACARICEVLADLKGRAEQESKERIKALKEALAHLEPAARKQHEEELMAAASSEYLAKREQVLTLVYTWFAQDYLRASGVAAASLPNPEFYDGWNGAAPAAPGVGECERNLGLVEELLNNLRFNVDERLVIQDFCQQVCMKT